MELAHAGLLAVVVLLALLACGIPIAWAMGAVGVVGSVILMGVNRTAAQVALTVWENGTLFVFIALPLFLLMGQLAYRTGIADDFYDCVQKWVGRLPGGLAVAAVVSNAAYGSVTGNSIAAVATMGPMVMPQFRAYGYNLSLATGTLASAGTLAVLVPPSALMVIYGVWTETSIGDLFIAGILPCLLLAVVYCLVLIAWCTLRPQDGPRGPRYPLRERLRSLAKLVPTLTVMGIVLGGIYGGVMTPAEASGVGVAGVLAVAGVTRRLTWSGIATALRDAAATSGMVFAIVVCGILFSRFLVHTQVTGLIVDWISSLGLGRVGLLISLLVFYFILGTALDTFGMLILSLPFVLPVVVAAGVDKVWFGVFVAVMVELAAVSPPVGITVAVMRSVAPDVPTTAIFRGCYPFLVLTILLALTLIWFPALALWLPQVARS